MQQASFNMLATRFRATEKQPVWLPASQWAGIGMKETDRKK
jgi:hypothetical protein